MATNWLRRTALLAACACAVLLAACGSGSIESQLTPSRVVAFGDGMADLGQGGSRYTVNDGSQNIWTQQVAASFSLNLTTVGSGGTSYATGNARVVAKPDAAGSNATPTVKEQIDSFLATGAFGSNDLVFVSAGTADVIAEGARAIAGAQTSEQMHANLKQAGRDLGAQVRRLVASGAKYVVVVGSYNLGKSPWAHQQAQQALLTEASSKFNEEMLVSIVDLGANVLYVDAALHYNLVTATPSNYSMDNVTDTACNSADAGVGIGTGTGQVNSARCTPSTVRAGVDPGRYVFADRVYPTPQGHRLFGDYAFQRIRARW